MYKGHVEELLANKKKKSKEDYSLAKDFISDTTKYTVMVIDDDHSQLFSIKKILRDSYELLICDRGIKAIDCYKKNQEKVMAILLDIRLPDIDGFEVFKKIKEINNEVPIIFITGQQGTYGDGFDVYKTYRPHGYIVKNHENEINMILNTLSSAINWYANLLKAKKGEIFKLRTQTISGLLHDLNNLLSPLVQLPDLLIRSIEKKDLEISLILANKLKKIIELYHANQVVLFNFAKGENLKLDLKLYDLTKLIKGFLETTSDVYNSLKINASLNYTENIVTDKNILLYQVINNIIKNSKEACRDRDCIVTIKTMTYKEYKDTLKDKIKFYDKNDNDPILIISDNGPGIPEEIAKNLFTPYVTMGKKNGSGLGMWMIKTGVESCLNGEIALDNKPFLEVAFHIWFPKNQY